MAQLKKAKDSIPEALEAGIKGLHRAIKKSVLYPPGHPFRVKAAGEIHKSLQRILSEQENHSLTAIENKLYIDQYKTADDERYYVGSERIYADLARRFRQRGIRSVTFLRGIELWEMGKFLDITTMRARETVALGGAGELLRSDGDVSHIEIVDIEYESIEFEEDGEESSMSAEEILLLYLRGGCEHLEDSGYAYLLSLLEESDQMARLIEDCIDYDGVSEPKLADLIRCMENLTDLGDQFTEQEKRAFMRKILEAILEMESPVKNSLFSSPDDDGLLNRLLSSLSIDEIVQSVLQESKTDEPAIPLRRIFDELLTPDQSQKSGTPEAWLAELESSIQAESKKSGQEDIFKNTIAPLLEEAFVELEINRLEDQQLELERLLDESHYPKSEQTPQDELDLFADVGEVISSASVLLEMLKAETDPKDYSIITGQLEKSARTLIEESHETTETQDQYFSMVFEIIDALSSHADGKSGKFPVLQERAKQAITNICTDKNTDLLLSALLKSEDLEHRTLERFVQQVGDKSITPLVKNLLDTESWYVRDMLTDMLVSMGSAVVPELYQWMRQTQWGAEIRVLIPVLNEIGGTDDPDSLSDKLNHPNPQVRRAAIVDLAISKSPRATEMIWEKINDRKEEEFIRAFAISILGEIGDEQTIEELVKTIKGKNASLRREAIYALGNIGGEKPISILSKLIKQRRPIRNKRTEELQLYAIETLGRMGTRQTVEILLKISERKKGHLKIASDKALRSRYQELR